MHPYRSLLFVPGHKPDWAAKAVASGADAVVLDLEDSVPEDLKQRAREQVAGTIRQLARDGVAADLLVRPNALSTGTAGEDLEAVVGAGLAGIFAPKVRDGADVVRWETLLEWFEHRNGAPGVVLVVPVETIEAIHHCGEIAGASGRVGALVGPTAEHADIARAVGFQWTRQGSETLYLRSRVLLACRQYGVHPLTGLWERLDDLAGLRDFAGQGRQLGYRGQVVIHPSHVPVVNEVFTPTAEEIAFHQGLVAAFEEATARGDGAVRYRGVHIDRAHADTARDWLAYARRVAAGPARE